MIKPSAIAPFTYDLDKDGEYVIIVAKYGTHDIYDFKMTNLELEEWAKELLKVADELVDLHRVSNPNVTDKWHILHD